MYFELRDIPRISPLVKHILRSQNHANISIMTAFCEQAAHFLGINFVQKIVEDY